jgi:hypothetical protein
VGLFFRPSQFRSEVLPIFPELILQKWAGHTNPRLTICPKILQCLADIFLNRYGENSLIGEPLLIHSFGSNEIGLLRIGEFVAFDNTATPSGNRISVPVNN